ncbi:MAG: TonB-dependent receptor, partial [Myxococcota bacterium]|nr:TonB-dependent receptor [Myxococcota bacterium]
AVVVDGRKGPGPARSVRAYARVLETDGDGLDITPKGRRNVSGTAPVRAINGGVSLQVGRVSLVLDVVDYRHVYLIRDQDEVFEVLLESVDEFQLAYHDEMLALRADLGNLALFRWSPYLYVQRYDDPGQYADVDISSSLLLSKLGASTLETTLTETEKHTARYALGVEFQAQPTIAHTTVGGLGMEAVQLVELKDLYFENGSSAPRADTYRADPGVLYDTFAFAQHTWTASHWVELTGGGRVDMRQSPTQEAQATVSPRAGLLLVPSPGVSWKLLYGRAFRAPNVRELLVEPSDEWTAGNPNLDDELIDTVEVEWSAAPVENLDTRAAAFHSWQQGLIDKVSNDKHPELGDTYYDNQDGANVVGAEVEAEYSLGAWVVGGSYAYTHAVDL